MARSPIHAFRLLLLIALGFACDKSAGEEQSPAVRAPPPMEQAEKARALTFCEKYVKRACDCAARHPELKEQCDLARAQPEALKLHFSLLEGSEGPLNPKERQMTEANARKVVAACVRSDGALDPGRCPRE
ncbi:MAG: hypothetical protein HY698_09215 [Deltaproteobacteria bacterium]|nr:hypothetical protein [Deltaproteobacteria bacterium]